MSGTLPAGMRMRGKVCLVTGGGSGIGRDTAQRMAAERAEAIVVAGRREAARMSSISESPAILTPGI